jgi:uncharacterized membrane protein YGL010W
MRTVDQWLDEYGESHRNPVNKTLHWICVPPIVLSVIGFVWSLPVPESFATLSAALGGAWVNWATLGVVASLAYYFMLSPSLAVGMLPVFAVMLGIVAWLNSLAWPLWLSSLVIFVVAWIGQFIGHAVEGRSPSFFKDVQFLMIGPLWLLSALYRRAGL